MKPSPIKSSQPVKWGGAESGRLHVRTSLVTEDRKWSFLFSSFAAGRGWTFFPLLLDFPSFLLIYFPFLSLLLLFIILCSADVCSVCQDKVSASFLLSLSNLPLSLHTYSVPGILTSSPHLLLAAPPAPPLSSGSSVDFLSPGFFYSVFLCVPLFFFPLSRDNRQALFGAIFSADSLWFMCPSSHLPKGHQGRAQKTQAVKHLFLASPQLFSLLSFLTRVSFFSPHLPVILPCLHCRSWSVSSPSKQHHPTPSLTTTHSLISNHLEFVVHSTLL